MLIGRRFQVIFTRATTGANAGADHTVYHIHMPVAPRTKLFVNFQQCIQQLKWLL